MATWEPTKPAERAVEIVPQEKYNQMVAELSEVLYSYLYQLHSSSKSLSSSINSRKSISADIQQQEEFE